MTGRRKKKFESIKTVLLYVALIFMAFIMLIPFAWMISASFDAAKKREIQMGMSRNELYRTTFRSAADSVPADYFTTHHSLREIVVALKDGMDDKNGGFCLYDENKNIVLIFPDLGERYLSIL